MFCKEREANLRGPYYAKLAKSDDGRLAFSKLSPASPEIAPNELGRRPVKRY